MDAIDEMRCKIGWHTPTKITKLGILSLSRCSRCKKSIQKDSQGNWYVDVKNKR